MPTNLGVLPSGLAIPTGRAQIKRGAAEAAINITSANVGQIISDGAGGLMQIAYTPTYACWWVVHGNVMVHGVDSAWVRSDYGIYVSPADAEGVTLGYQCCMQSHPSVEWRTWSGSYMFKLNPGVAYVAHLAWASVPGGVTIAYHSGGGWLRITGRIVGEGAL